MLAKLCVMALATIYVILLVACPCFGIVDDHQVATTIERGESPHFPLNVSTQNGHFEPLDSQEYTVLGKLFDFTPGMCYSFNAAQIVLLVAISWGLLEEFVPTLWVSITIGLLLLSPGFVAAWFRLNVGERGALFWTVACLYSVQMVRRRGDWRWIVMAAVTCNLALYYKEPVFAGMAAFSVLELIAGRAGGKLSRTSLAHALILTSAAVFVSIYIVVITRHQTGDYADQRRFVSTVRNQIVGFRTYMLVGHPLIVFVLVPDAIAAGFRAIRTRFKEHSTLDSMSIAGLSYVAVVTMLDLPTNSYYLVPAYAFGLAPVAKRLSSVTWRAMSHRTWSLVIIVLMALCALPLTWIVRPLENHPFAGQVVMMASGAVVVAALLSSKYSAAKIWSIFAASAIFCAMANQVRTAVNELVAAKYGPWNFQCLLVELRTAVQASHPRPVPIFLLESPRAFYVEAYHSIGEYLQLNFAVGRDFDLFSEAPPDSKFVPDLKSPYSVLRKGAVAGITPGAILVGRNFSLAQLDRWSTSGRLMYVSSRPYWLRMFSLDSLIQRMRAKLKAGLGVEGTEIGTNDFCLLVAK